MNHQLTVWQPPASPQTYGSASDSFPLSNRRLAFEKPFDLQASLCRQLEDTVKIAYQIKPSPEKPFASPWQTMGMPPVAIRINPQTTLFVDPVAVTKYIQKASVAQQRAVQTQPVPLTAGREFIVLPSGTPCLSKQQIGTFFVNVLSNPRFQGALQVLGGASEVSAGYVITWGSSGIAAPAGHFFIVHGMDHVTTGAYSVITGKHKITATELALQKAGMPPEFAATTDTTLSITGMAKGAKAASQLVSQNLAMSSAMAQETKIIEGAGALVNELKAGPRAASLESKAFSNAGKIAKTEAGISSTLVKPKSISWTEPRNLQQQLALQEAKANPGMPCKNMTIKDPKYVDNWTKMQHQHVNPDGTKINIHYWQNKNTGEKTGFKFKFEDN
ncbi:MAG TPA: hypothetical protein VFU89_07895 [Rhabdochlamydiaceae bacterium]|nr:hypothetical protein [Rhabdochlamydiaceae bacterium]